MLHLSATALEELGSCLERVSATEFDTAVAEISAARRIVLYGVGREGLQIKGLAMRLYHLGLKASVVGDMATPPLETGDLLIVSAGPGDFSTVSALMQVARQAGARVALVTAEPAGAAAKLAHTVLVVPAQTMANDEGQGVSVLPMGSLYEGALYILFELIILALRDGLGVSASAMRAKHTNLE